MDRSRKRTSPARDSAKRSSRRAPAAGLDAPPPDDRALARVEELASMGLGLEQIAVELDWPGLPAPFAREPVELAIRRGRAKGAAAIKRAHYKTALEGSVNAQRDMLALLEKEETDDGTVLVDEVTLDPVPGPAMPGEAAPGGGEELDSVPGGADVPFGEAD